MARKPRTEIAAIESHDEHSPAIAPELIRMAKDGEMLNVHPSCVKDHERVGWVRVAE